MKKLNKSTKILATGLAAGLLGLLTAASVSAWGPDRATFTMEDPAEYPVFNSITNNPTIGDERDFVRIGEIDADATSLGNNVEIVPGKQYLVYIYFHNNASSTFNDSAHNHSGVATVTKLASSFSTVITPSDPGTVTATITASNTNPLSVWDEASMTTTYKKVLLSYVAGSAKIYNDWSLNGTVLSSSLFTEGGTLLGVTSLNGVVPGCEEYHGVVTYVLQAEELGGTVEKTASLDGTSYDTNLTAKEGDEVYFKLTIKNTGDVALSNATIRDSLPAGLTLVPGSVELSANNSSVKDPLSDDITGAGYNLGTVGTGNTVYITYRAKVGTDAGCALTNTATLIYDSEAQGGDSDTSSVKLAIDKAGCEIPAEIVSTGPVEIVMAVIIVLGIAGGGFYLYRTSRTLKTVKNEVSGASPSEEAPKSDEEEPKN